MGSFKIIATCSSVTEACDAVGVIYSPNQLRVNHWKALDLKNDPKGKNDGRIILFEGGSSGCVVNWKTLCSAVWFDYKRNPYFASVNQELERRKSIQRFQYEKLQQHYQAAEFASYFWNLAWPIKSHPYLDLKHVKAVQTLRAIEYQRALDLLGQMTGKPWHDIYGSKGHFCRTDLLVVPLRGEISNVQSVQLIDAKGSKFFLKHGMKKGAYWQSVKLPHIDLVTTQMIGIAEGVATALTVSQLKEIPVFSAMDCGNLKSVAHVVRQRFPKSHILILGDVGNGAEQAVEAAKEVGGLCVFPEFSDELVARFHELCGPGLPTDFNDYYLAKGEI